MKTIKSTLLIISAISILFVESCSKETELAPQQAGSKSLTSKQSNVAAASFKVVGYLPSWAGDVNAVQYSKLTHINYSFLIPTSSGGYDAIDNPSKLTSMVTLAHNNNVKAIISVGGGGGGDGFAGIVASAANRTTFVNNMVSFTNQYNLDGVDIDWEYPSTGTQSDNFTLMMQQLATAMHNNGKILSIAVIGEDGDYVESGVISAVDYLEIMAYDDNNFQHSTYELGTQCLAYWLGRSVPVAKAILGVPFYGHDSSVDEDDSEVNYNTIIANGGNPNLDVSGTIGYNGIRTIKSKTSYAMSQAGGITMWDLSGDATGANSLVTAINQVVTAGGTVSTGAPVGTTVTFKGFNNLYVSSENGASAMQCVAATAAGWESFLVVDAGHGKVALENLSKFVSSEDGTTAITCNRTSYSTWEVFDWITLSTGQVTLRSTNGLFISSENGTKAMTCTRTSASGWEAFGINQ